MLFNLAMDYVCKLTVQQPAILLFCAPVTPLLRTMNSTKYMSISGKNLIEIIPWC